MNNWRIILLVFVIIITVSLIIIVTRPTNGCADIELPKGGLCLEE